MAMQDIKHPQGSTHMPEIFAGCSSEEELLSELLTFNNSFDKNICICCIKMIVALQGDR